MIGAPGTTVINSPTGTGRLVFEHYQLGARMVTTCKVLIANEAVLNGASICAPGDRCNAELGERKALAKALEGLPSDVRMIIWQTYEESNPFLGFGPELSEAGYGAGV
jgi:hypothetical protein